MKKLSIILISILFLTACTNKYNFKGLEKELKELNSTSFDYQVLSERLDKELDETINLEDLKLRFNIDSSLFTKALIRTNVNEKLQLIMVLEPKNINEAKQTLESFFKNIQTDYSINITEINQQLVYLMTDNNEKYLKIIREAGNLVINNLVTTPKNELLKKYGLEENLNALLLEEDILNGNKIIIIETTTPEDVKGKLENYFQRIESFDSESNKLKYENKIIKLYNNLVVCVITNDNQKVLQVIEDNI